jgi:hypothetical protein
MQKQKKENRQVAPRFIRAAVLTAGILLGSCAARQQYTGPQQISQEKPPRDFCITIREAMQERVGACKDSQDFSACVFGQRMLFSTKYESTEELEVEAGLKQDVLAELGIALMSNGRSRELIIREIRPGGVLFGMGFGMHDRATVPMGSKQLISIGGARKLERLDRVKGGEFFYRFDGSNEDEANARIRGMGVEIMSVQRTANGVRIRLVADLYENCLVE